MISPDCDLVRIAVDAVSTGKPLRRAGPSGRSDFLPIVDRSLPIDLPGQRVLAVARLTAKAGNDFGRQRLGRSFHCRIVSHWDAADRAGAAPGFERWRNPDAATARHAGSGCTGTRRWRYRFA